MLFSFQLVLFESHTFITFNIYVYIHILAANIGRHDCLLSLSGYTSNHKDIHLVVLVTIQFKCTTFFQFKT